MTKLSVSVREREREREMRVLSRTQGTVIKDI